MRTFACFESLRSQRQCQVYPYCDNNFIKILGLFDSFSIFAACYQLNIIMAEYKVTPMKDRTVCGWIAVVSFIIGLVLCDWVMRAKSPLNHHSHQPTKLRRFFLSSPPSSPSSVFSVKIVVLSKISTFSFITIALIDIFCIFAEDKLHLSKTFKQA